MKNSLKIKFYEHAAKAHVLFAVIALVFGICFIRIVPPFWGIDEPAHFARAYQVSNGEIRAHYVGNTLNKGYGGGIPSNFERLIPYVVVDFSNPAHKYLNGAPLGQVDNKDYYKNLDSEKVSRKMTVIGFSGAAAYSPVPYVPAASALKISKGLDLNIGKTIFLTRFFNLVSYIAICALALYILRSSKLKWLFLAIALLPAAVFQTSIINADGVNNAILFLLSAFFVKTIFVKQKLNKLETALLAASIVLLPLIKSTYILFLFLLPLISNKMLAFKKPNYFKIGTALVALCVFALWLYATKDIPGSLRLMKAGFIDQVSVSAQQHFVITHPIAFVGIILRTLLLHDNYYSTGIIGILGFNQIVVPSTAIILSLLSMAGAVILAAQEKLFLTSQYIGAIWGVLFINVLAIFYSLYITWNVVRNPIVEGIQGRYFIAFMPLLLMLAAVVVSKHFPKLRTTNRLTIIVVSSAIISLFLSVLKYNYVTWG